MIRDVVIVGGGPVGLMLACELRLAGIQVTVLEQLLEPSGFSKALGFSGRSVDTLDHRGLLERFSEGIPSFNTPLAHFSGIPLDLRRLEGSQPKPLFIQQARVEELLEERAHELGAKLRWGHELAGLWQDEDGVTIDVRDPNGDYQLRTRFLVGCDGGRSVVRKLAGIAFPGTDASRQAERYRAGRVLLAGDAAHIHLPAGGPGLSTGLQDAVNLGWKLAAEIHGWAPPGLLDTYHAERHPVGRRVLMHTRAQGALLGAGEHVAALRELFTELLENDQTLHQIVDLLQGTDIRYDMDAGVVQHPLVGRWAPNLRLVTAEGTIYVPQLMHRARGVLLDLAGRASLRDVARGWTDRVDVIAARCEQPAPADALLIRPDGYVAWVAAVGEPDEDAQCGLLRALATWFGAAALAEHQKHGPPIRARSTEASIAITRAGIIVGGDGGQRCGHPWG